jgi:DNA repair exonuclease SbcCD ATPase subunit
MATHEDSSKLLYWILTALLGVVMAIGGFYLKELQARLEQYAAREAQRYETLNSTNALRGERLVAIETRVSNLDPRLNAAEGKLGAMEPRLPLLESKLSQADERLKRIEEKLDRLLATKGSLR